MGVFDEKQYFLGESALLAGSAHRALGERDEADLWLDRAEAAFRHTINSAPQMASVSYARLTLHYDRRQYERVFAALPSLISTFENAGMKREVMKCGFLEAMALKESGRREDSRSRLERLHSLPALAESQPLLGLIAVNLGELLAAEGRGAEAAGLYIEALQNLEGSSQPMTVAHLKAAVAEGLRNEGQFAAASDAYAASIQDYEELGMATQVAYLRIVRAETLIASNRPRQAEWEILAALPTIEEQKMVSEGFAAVALLKESVSRRKTDPNALRELREHLQAATK